MDIQVLSNFLVVAREGNITKAAELVHLTQSTLSRQMIGLEKELGVTLLDRQKYRVVLTEEGMLFRRRAQEIVSLSDMAKDELIRTNEEILGEVAIGCNESQSMSSLADRIVAFRKRHPMITFDIRSGNNSDVKEWLDHGIVDVGLLGEPVDVTKYSYVRMPEKDEWGVLLSEHNPLAKEESLAAKDLVGIPMITIRDEVIHSELTSWSGKYAGRMVPIMHYNLLSNAAALIADDKIVAICARPSCDFKGLTFRPFEPELKLGSLLAWKEQQVFSKATTAFLSFLKEGKTETQQICI